MLVTESSTVLAATTVSALSLFSACPLLLHDIANKAMSATNNRFLVFIYSIPTPIAIAKNIQSVKFLFKNPIFLLLIFFFYFDVKIIKCFPYLVTYSNKLALYKFGSSFGIGWVIKSDV